MYVGKINKNLRTFFFLGIVSYLGLQNKTDKPCTYKQHIGSMNASFSLSLVQIV